MAGVKEAQQLHIKSICIILCWYILNFVEYKQWSWQLMIVEYWKLPLCTLVKYKADK